MKKKVLISIPAYNESENIFPLYEKISSVLKYKREEIDFEILFIDDGSTDGSVETIMI